MCGHISGYYAPFIDQTTVIQNDGGHFKHILKSIIISNSTCVTSIRRIHHDNTGRYLWHKTLLCGYKISVCENLCTCIGNKQVKEWQLLVAHYRSSKYRFNYPRCIVFSNNDLTGHWCSRLLPSIIYYTWDGNRADIFKFTSQTDILCFDFNFTAVGSLGPLLLTWFNFNPSMDK